MQLARYLKISGLTDAQFAAMVGASRSIVVKWRRGERSPRPDAVRRIMLATGGDVTPNDLFSPPAATDQAAASMTDGLPAQ